MKKILFILGILPVLLFFSCKTPPETSDAEFPDSGMTPLTEPGAGEGSAPAEDIPSIILPLDEPGETDIPFELIEPGIDFPEITTPASPPGDRTSQPTEIPAPPSELPKQEPVPEEVPQTPSGTTGPGSGTPPAGPVEPEVPVQPPAPPSFLRPAEPDTSSSVTREPLVMPVNPIPEAPAVTIPQLEDGDIVFSRTVRATVGQIIEIPFRGTGWVFLGEIGSRRGIAYDSRRLDPEGQTFIFRAESPGTYILKFYKEDFIRDYILNDHVQVIIGDVPETSGTGWFNAPVDRGRVIAEPRWPPEYSGTTPPAASAGTASPAASPQTSPAETASPGAAPQTPSTAAQGETRPQVTDDGIVQVTPTAPPGSAAQAAPPATTIVMPQNASPDDYVNKAKEEYDAGRIGSAISILEQFKQRYPSGSDEAFWLLGQFYEANSPHREIRTSLDYYRRLVNEYPQSKRYNDAKRRIAYLERYYFNIR